MRRFGGNALRGCKPSGGLLVRDTVGLRPADERLSRLRPRGPRGGPRFDTKSKSPLPSTGKEPGGGKERHLMGHMGAG